MIGRPPRRAAPLPRPEEATTRRATVPAGPPGTSRPARADGVAFALALVLGAATLATLYRFFQFVAWA